MTGCGQVWYCAVRRGDSRYGLPLGSFFLGMVKVQKKITMIGNLEPEERVLDMGNSPTDKSKNFIRSGMTLITQIDSDKHLKKVRDDRRKDSSEAGRDNT